MDIENLILVIDGRLVSSLPRSSFYYYSERSAKQGTQRLNSV